MLRFIQWLLAWSMLLCLWSQAAAVSTDSFELENRANGLQQQLDSLQVARTQFQGQGDILAQRIQLYRSKTDLNAREHHHLEKLLQESQILGQTIKILSDQIARSETGLKEIIQQIIQRIQTQMETVARSLENPQISEGEKENYLARFNQLLKSKETWEKRYPAIRPVPQFNFALTIDPTDTPRRLKLKGALLQDQEKRYREEAEQVQTRIHALEKEQTLRRQVQTLTQDMSLFNEQEELLGRRESSLLTRNYYDFWNEDVASVENGLDEKVGVQEQFIDFAPSIDLHQGSYEPGSWQSLEGAIEQLRLYEKRMTGKADSLKTEAQKFLNAAEGRNQ